MRGHRRFSSLRLIGRYATTSLLTAWLGGVALLVNADAGSWPTPPATSAPPPQISGPLQGGTADHTKFDELKGPFTNGSKVTQACLGCHTETGEHFMQNIHWTWSYQNPNTGQQLGKRYLINNFCTNSRGNEGMCAQCHAGYGWKDESFDFTDETKIDCLVCHETTGTYYKTPNSPRAACLLGDVRGQAADRPRCRRAERRPPPTRQLRGLPLQRRRRRQRQTRRPLFALKETAAHARRAHGRRWAQLCLQRLPCDQQARLGRQPL